MTHEVYGRATVGKTGAGAWLVQYELLDEAGGTEFTEYQAAATFAKAALWLGSHGHSVQMHRSDWERTHYGWYVVDLIESHT